MAWGVMVGNVLAVGLALASRVPLLPWAVLIVNAAA